MDLRGVYLVGRPGSITTRPPRPEHMVFVPTSPSPERNSVPGPAIEEEEEEEMGGGASGPPAGGCDGAMGAAVGDILSGCPFAPWQPDGPQPVLKRPPESQERDAMHGEGSLDRGGAGTKRALPGNVACAVYDAPDE